MPLSDSQKAALNRLQSFYEGDNPYNSVSNPGGFRQGGHLYNFVPALKDLASVITGCAALAVEVATNSAQSPKAVRVDGDQTYTDAEKAQGQKNLGLAQVLTSFVAKAGDTMKGVLNMAFANPYISLVNKDGGTWDGYKWNILHYGPDGCYYLQAVDAAGNGSNPLQLKRDGSMILSQIGDLNTRIETRAAAFAAQRLALTGGTLTGTLNVNAQMQLNSGAGEQSFFFTRDNVPNTRLVLGSAGDFYINTMKGGSDYYWGFSNNGGFTTPQFGDLNTRIEARGAAYRDAALTTARSEFNAADALRVLKAGDTMTGQLKLDYVKPSLMWYYAGKAAYRWRVSDTGNFEIVPEAADTQLFGINGSGAVSTLQIGDLNTRIEARGLAYQQAAQGTSVQNNVASDQQMVADFRINKATPRFYWNHPNVRQWAATVETDGHLSFYDVTGSALRFRMEQAASFYTAQIGDLNTRIETRAAAFADDRIARAVTSGRWIYAGQKLCHEQPNTGGFIEPAGPHAMECGYWTFIVNDGSGNGAPFGKRWRVFQILVNGNWVTTGAAS